MENEQSPDLDRDEAWDPSAYRWLSESSDYYSIATVAAAVCAQLAAILLDMPYWILPLIIVLCRQAVLVEHNHAHLRLCKSPTANEILGWLCFVATGVPLQFFEVHHVQNHHGHYRDGSNDWSDIYDFQGARYPDRPVGRLYYILTFPFISNSHSLLHLLRKPQTTGHRQLLRAAAAILGALSLLAWTHPQGVVLFVLLPWLIVSFGLGANTYNYHLGCDRNSPYTASNVCTDLHCRHLGFNIGYHVAHHLRPQLHWSRLPEFHEQIKHRIPTENHKRWGLLRFRDPAGTSPTMTTPVDCGPNPTSEEVRP